MVLNIMLGMRIKNMEYCFPECWQSILDLDYPKHNIDIYIIENDSTIDETKKLVDETRKRFKRKFRSFTVDHLELDQKRVKYWDRHRSEGDFWLHANNFIMLHNKRFYPKALEREDKYFLSVAADNILHPNTVKAYLEAFEYGGHISWVSGILNRRKSADGKPAVYQIKPRKVDKPWRLIPTLNDELSSTIYFPYRVHDIPQLESGGLLDLIGYGVTMQPTELTVKYPLSYNIGDVVLSYVVQARADGYRELLLPYIMHKHVDRDGMVT